MALRALFLVGALVKCVIHHVGRVAGQADLRRVVPAGGAWIAAAQGAASARAALDAAVINVEINLAAMNDPARRDALRAELDKHTAAADTAAALLTAVR